jgi:predicted nucleic acid-binding protein
MPASVFFDSSVLLYILSLPDSTPDPRSAIAGDLLLKGGAISVQVLNEFANVARRKLKMDWEEIEQALTAISTLCGPVLPITVAMHEAGVRIAQRYQLQFYDSVIVAAALEAKVETLLTEDLQHGQVIHGLTIRNPFRTIAT